MIASFANQFVADQPVVKMEASPSPDGRSCRSYQIMATDQRFPSKSLSDLDDVMAPGPNPDGQAAISDDNDPDADDIVAQMEIMASWVCFVSQQVRQQL